ncbi:hypothetical protein A2U01_0065763, partial [Trifolium medium]|nr:hypothetical protein [Trifolium medium]
MKSSGIVAPGPVYSSVEFTASPPQPCSSGDLPVAA